MTHVLVDTAQRILTVKGEAMPCAIGRSGACAAADKREGDGCTPRGAWPIRTLLLRPGVVLPRGTQLPWRHIGSKDGWCDAPADPAYNRPVRLPYPASAETLLREDGLYDLVVTLGHNDTPPIAGLGSAIFLHCWRDVAPTEGCVAVARSDLERIVARLQPGDVLDIR